MSCKQKVILLSSTLQSWWGNGSGGVAISNVLANASAKEFAIILGSAVMEPEASLREPTEEWNVFYDTSMSARV